MNIKGVEENVNQVDSLLTTLTKVLKKHWIILLLILMGTGVYYFFQQNDDPAINVSESSVPADNQPAPSQQPKANVATENAVQNDGQNKNEAETSEDATVDDNKISHNPQDDNADATSETKD